MSSTSLIETYKCVPCDRDVTVTNKENHEKTEFHLKNLRKKDCHKCEIEKEEYKFFKHKDIQHMEISNYEDSNIYNFLLDQSILMRFF
jgi:hypothetical protein